MTWDEVNRLVRDQIDREFAAGYPTLRNVPDGRVWRQCSTVDTLTPEDRDTLFSLLAERACLWFQTDDVGPDEVNRRYEALRNNAFLNAFHSGIGAQNRWKYADPRYMRMFLDNRRKQLGPPPPKSRLRSGRGAAARPDPAEAYFRPVPLAAIEAVDPPVKCKAAEVRAAVKRTFADRFQMKQVNGGHGNWNYPGEFQGRRFVLALFWGWSGGPEYGIYVGDRTDMVVQPPAWENVLGFGTGRWDFLCEHNLSASLDVLGKIIETAVMLLPNMRHLI